MLFGAIVLLTAAAVMVDLLWGKSLARRRSLHFVIFALFLALVLLFPAAQTAEETGYETTDIPYSF